MDNACGCHSHNGFLTAKGLTEAEQRSLEGLDAREVSREVDKVVSVSALPVPASHWDDEVIEEQHRRFIHHG